MTVLTRLFAPKRPEPSYPDLPYVDAHGESNVPGIHVTGELAGVPLVKLGLNAGHRMVQRLASELSGAGATEPDVLDLVIVGSGSSGFAAAVAAQDLGLRAVTLESDASANTFVTTMKGKWLFAEPEDVSLESRVWFEECTKEELLERWRRMKDEEGLDIREHEKVIDIQGHQDDFRVISDVAEYRARRVILAMGKAGNPRKLGVPGEKTHAARIHHRLLDADDFHGQSIVIVGAGDVACEAAIALAADATNTVTLSAIDPEFTYPKKRNIDAVRQLEADGRLRILLGSSVRGITAAGVEVERADGGREEIPAQSVFEMIGAELPLGFFRKVGIRLAQAWTPKRWVILGLLFLFVYSLYALKSYGKGLTAWPFEALIAPAAFQRGVLAIFDVCFWPFSWLFSAEALQDIRGDLGFQQGFLYSGLYTLVMAVFGYEALVRWRKKAKRPGYQTWRYVSLIGFQVGFFLIVNVVAVKAMSVEYAWRAWGLYQPYPLFFNTFFWWYPQDSAWIFWFFVGAGLLGTFVLIPWLSRNHGKRFCTWVCGCGGLAETLGDRWRHLSAKGERSRAWEFQSVAVLLASVIVGIVIVDGFRRVGNSSGESWWWHSYNYLVDFWLVAVIPITLYPFFGGKVWCRYWCPLAAYNGLLARWYGRLKIISNDKCITCTECSTYCQVGVDVMAFAKNQQPFDNTNSACIQCGICIDVCPMDVLSFETSAPKATTLISDGRSSGRADPGSGPASTAVSTPATPAGIRSAP